jgi:hypothetical protein
MRLVTLLLAAAANVIAQDLAAASSVLSAAAASLTELGSVPSITDPGSFLSVTLPAAVTSLEAQGSCLTGSSYLNCISSFTDGNICTQVDVSSRLACACSTASKYYGYVSIPRLEEKSHLGEHELTFLIK